VLKKLEGGRRASEGLKPKIEAKRDQLQRWEDWCAKRGEQPADVALAWHLANPVVTAPIIGPLTMGQLTGSLRALEIKLDEQAMKELDAIWPGPGGEAPKAYAW
jgi:aryl-alcohol dehydrogenase-like predicted oxidoreductase